MDLKISQLLDGGAAQGSDQIAIARSGGSYELTLAEVQTFVLGTLASDVSTNTANITALQNDRLKLDGSNGPMTGTLDMGANKITSTYVPAADADLVNRKYITDNYLPLAGGVMTGPITLHSTGTPGGGAEPVSYTFAEATYAKASGTVDYVARFTPSGTELGNGIIRDTGSEMSISTGGSTAPNTSYLAYIYSTGKQYALVAQSVRTSSNAYGIYALADATNTAGNLGLYGFAQNGATYNIGVQGGAGTTAAPDNVNAGVYGDATYTSSTAYGGYFKVDSSNTSSNIGLKASALNSNTGLVLGGFFTSSSSANTATVRGVEITASTSGTATPSTVRGIQINSININGTSATDVYGIYVNGVIGAGTVTDAYGIYVEQHSTGTNKWGIYQVGANDTNYFAGNVYIGATTGTTKFRLVDGTEAANYYLQTDANGNASWVLLNSATLDGISGTTNQVAYFSGTDLISGDADWLFDGTTMSIGEALDATVLSNVYTSSLANAMKVENANTSGVTYAMSVSNNASSASANYAIYADATNGGAGAAWGIYQVGTGSTNYMEGNTAIGLSNSLDRIGSNIGIQINGDDDNKAIVGINSNSSQNAYIVINHNSVDSDAGVSGDLNSLVIFQEDSTTEWMLGLNGTASSATNCRSIAKEFVISNGITFDDRSDRQFVMFPTGECGIGTDAVEGTPLTIGTATRILEIDDAVTGGVEGANTMNGYIKVYLSTDDDGGTGEVPGTRTVAYIRTYDGIA